jgi:hypothetical protein
MKISTGVPIGAPSDSDGRNFCRRMMAAAVLAACVFVAPVIASASRAPLHEVRLPRIDFRVIENLQRWADGGKDFRCEEL